MHTGCGSEKKGGKVEHRVCWHVSVSCHADMAGVCQGEEVTDEM